MKKILSTFLSLAIVLTTVLSIPFATSAIITPNAGYGNPTEIFDSTDDNDWLQRKIIYTDAEQTTTADNSSRWNLTATNQYKTIGEYGVTEKILASNEIATTDIENFEWNFMYQGSTQWARSAFVFHVDEERTSNPTTLKNFANSHNITNAIAIGICGTQVTGVTAASAGKPAANMRPNTLTVFIPDTTTGALVPLQSKEYTASEINAMYSAHSASGSSMVLPDENGYLDLGNISIATYFTINVKLEGQKLTLTATQGENTVSKEFTLPLSALAIAPKGDFAIATGNTNFKIKNMTVNNITSKEKTDGLIFDSTELDKAGYDWITKNNNITADDTYDADRDARNLPSQYVSGKILTNNGYSSSLVNSIDNFVWELEYASMDNRYAGISFIFHSGANSGITSSGYGTGGFTNSMGVTLYSPATATNANQGGRLLVVNAAGASGGLVAAKSNGSKPLSSLQLKENCSVTVSDTVYPSYLENKTFYTVRMTYNEGRLLAEIWKSDNKDETYQKYYYEYSAEQIAAAPSGDFAIRMPNTSCCIRNMKIYSTDAVAVDESLVFDSDNFSGWIKNGNPNATVDQTPYNTTPSYNIATGEVTLPEAMASTAILKDNGYNETVLDDFVWEFQYKPADAVNNETTFLYHVNEDRSSYKSTLPTDTAVGAKSKAVKCAFGITLYGSGDKFKTQSYAWQNALTIDFFDGGSVYSNAHSYKTTNKDYLPEGVTQIYKPVSYVPIKTVDTNGNAVDDIRDVYYTVQVKMSGATVIVSIWQSDNKEATYSYAVCNYNNAQDQGRAPSGDFAIIQEAASSGTVKNMKIYNGTKSFESSDDYSKYDSFATKYTFDNDTEGLIGSYGETTTGATQADGRLVLAADESVSTYINNLDGGNNNLGDFVMQFDFTDDKHGWSTDYIVFRSENANNNYRLRFKENGSGTGTFDPSGTVINAYVYLEKVENGTVTVLAKTPIGLGFMEGQIVTVRISAVGDQIKVWLAGEGVVYNEPIIEVTDITFSTGYMVYSHLKGNVYLDNIEIYDITAYNAAQTINEGTSDVKRGMDEEIFALRKFWLGLHASQRAKLADQKAALDAAKTMLDEIEFKANDANGSGDIDIRDLVALRNFIAKGTLDIITEDTDPVFDNVIDANDIAKIRDMIINDDGKINILAIGNSYTQDSFKWVAQIADSLDINDYHFANMFRSGRSVPEHANAAMTDKADYAYETYAVEGMTDVKNVTIKQALDDKAWDIVIFQTSPTGAASADGYEDLDVLIEYIKGSEGMDVKFMWQNSWAFARHDYPETFPNYNANRLEQGKTLYADENGNYSQQLMHGMIKDTLVEQFVDGAYADVIGLDGVIPVGLAIQGARDTGKDFRIPQENPINYWDLTRDGYHLSNNLGKYIAGLTILRQLTGKDIVYTDTIYNSLNVGSPATVEQLKVSIDVVNAAFVERDALAK